MKEYEITRLCDISWTDFADPMIGVCFVPSSRRQTLMMRDMLVG